MTRMEKWVREHADVHLRHGGKTWRRRSVKRLIAALDDIHRQEPGVVHPAQVGRGHIHRYYLRHRQLASATLTDHYRAFCLLWKLLGRAGSPPRPEVTLKNVSVEQS